MSMPSETNADDLVEIQAHLAPASGPDYWRSLEELAGTEKFQHYLHREFPENSTEWTDPESRRHFLKIMGASIALAGVSGCAIRRPEQIAPWTKSPEQIVPGRPQFYATAMTMGGLATGLLVESHAGRPTKIEGNPDHPASLGSTDIFAQAATLNLYDPDRSQVVLREGQVGLYDDFLAALTAEMDRLRPKKGAGLRILTEAIGSPGLANQIKELLAAFPEAKWHHFEGVGKDSARAGSKLAFGEVVDPVYRFDKADVILSLDADFLACGSPGRVADERAFAARREPKAGVMNRLYVAEGAYTNTGAAADHRLAIKPSQVADLAVAVAAGGGRRGATAPAATKTDRLSKWAEAVAKDLKAHKGKALVLVGEAQPAYVHALGHAINHAVGAIGPEGTVTFIEPIEADPVEHGESLAGLIKDIQAGQVDTLLILGGNPVYTAPANLDFAAALKKVPLTIRLGLYVDETSEHCTWHVPEAHFLESWSDARAFDGTASIVQPLIFPLYNGKTAHEILAAMMGQFDRSPLTVVRDYWRGQKGNPADFEATWRKALHDGKFEGTRPRRAEVGDSNSARLVRPEAGGPGGRDGDRLPSRPDHLGRPVRQLRLAPGTPQADHQADLGQRRADLDGDGQEAEARPRRRQRPGRRDQVQGADAGDPRLPRARPGRRHGGGPPGLRPDQGRPGRHRDGLQRQRDPDLRRPLGRAGRRGRDDRATYPLASTQMHRRNLDGRNHVRVATLADFIKDPNFVHKGEEHPHGSLTSSMYDWNYDSYKWGMAIDLNSCTGCNACVISCQAENNIPVIGKGQVEAGRLMQWMEIDTYFQGKIDDDGHPKDHIDAYFQPRTCMHCENAPCELVCPVGATVHDAEGLNVMVYNRCVGTRYCGNNCPYKVRHFNFLNYFDESQAPPR